VARTGFRRFRIFAILDTTFIAQIAAFLRLLLTLGGFAVLVGFFFYEASGLFNFAFNAHSALLFTAYVSVGNMEGVETFHTVFGASKELLVKYATQRELIPRASVSASPLNSAMQPTS
jgi:hypothetical protein